MFGFYFLDSLWYNKNWYQLQLAPIEESLIILIFLLYDLVWEKSSIFLLVFVSLVIPLRKIIFGGIFLKKSVVKNVSQKRREFAFVLYQESASEDWEQILNQLHQRVFWILHDKDMSSNGTPKKPHYHVMILFDNPRSSNTVRDLCIKCGGNGHLEELMSRRGYARYLCHMDDPDKHQYDTTEVHNLCGANYMLEIMSKTELKSNRLAMITEIIQFCDDNVIFYYADLIRYCIIHKPEWLELLVSYNGHIIKDYIKSSAYKYDKTQRR